MTVTTVYRLLPNQFKPPRFLARHERAAQFQLRLRFFTGQVDDGRHDGLALAVTAESLSEDWKRLLSWRIFFEKWYYNTFVVI